MRLYRQRPLTHLSATLQAYLGAEVPFAIAVTWPGQTAGTRFAGGAAARTLSRRPEGSIAAG